MVPGGLSGLRWAEAGPAAGGLGGLRRAEAGQAAEAGRGGPAEGASREAVGEAVEALQACCASNELQPRLEAQRRLVPA